MASGRRKGSTIDNGALVLVDETGATTQVVPPEVCDAVRQMVARLRLADGTDLPARLGLVSALSGEGVTTLSLALGLVLSNDLGRQVCVVDLNWWSPSPHHGSHHNGGAAAVIAGVSGLPVALVETGNPGLSVLPGGATTPSERPLLANSEALDAIFQELEERFDHVIVDLPALDVTSDALTLAEHVGDLIMVVHHGVTPESEVLAAVDKLAGLTVLGTILNAHTLKLPAFVKRRLPAF